jgi:hypothetical protein
VWTQQQRLTGADTAAGDWFGSSVSVSGDTVVVGARYHCDADVNCGSAYVFVRSGGVWTQQQKLIASGAGVFDFGVSVSVSGMMMAIGANGDNHAGLQSGSAYVFVRSGSIWTQKQKLTPSDAAAGGLFGGSVSVDGDTTVVGPPFDDGAGFPGLWGESGSAYVFSFASE